MSLKNSFNDCDDSELWDNFRNNNLEAFTVLFFRHYAFLFRTGKQMRLEEELVKDTLQEFFEYLWQHRQNLSEAKFPKLYLVKSFKRLLLNKITKSSLLVSVSDIDELKLLEQEPSVEKLLIEQQENQRQLIRLQEEIKKLPERQQEALHLKYFCEMDYDQISSTLNISYQSSRNLIHKAVQKLRESFSLRF
ncbi:MAG: RNA polymerase sigma factor [Adhaeribacter sp.]